MKIVSSPDQVCFDHALEFWTGLLAYVIDRSAPFAEHQRLITFRPCEELSASYPRVVAIANAGRSPRNQESFPIRLAS